MNEKVFRITTTILPNLNEVPIQHQNRFNELEKTVTLLRAEMPYTLTVTELPVISDDFANALGQAVQSVEQYIPEAQKKQYQDTILPKLNSYAKRFTVEDLRFILSLLVSIYFGVMSMLPDEQLSYIENQNEIIIAQQAEMIELQQENTELIETLEHVTDAIQSLTEQLDAIRAENKDPDHALMLNPESEDHADLDANDDPQQ